jgi:hypothetical protein
LDPELLRWARKQLPVTIIYIDRSGHLSRRTILIRKISRTRLLAYCYEKKAYRTFLPDRILAVAPARGGIIRSA